MCRKRQTAVEGKRTIDPEVRLIECFAASNKKRFIIYTKPGG